MNVMGGWCTCSGETPYLPLYLEVFPVPSLPSVQHFLLRNAVKGKVSQLITTYIRCGNINYSLGGILDKQLQPPSGTLVAMRTHARCLHSAAWSTPLAPGVPGLMPGGCGQLVALVTSPVSLAVVLPIPPDQGWHSHYMIDMTSCLIS